MTRSTILSIFLLLAGTTASPQTHMLLNGDFEEVNTCTEHSAECGVEGWFYLKEVKAQMLTNETKLKLLGLNSFGIYYVWGGYTAFTPVIGTILPCGLQKDKAYTFKGIISATLNAKLNLKPGICLGEKFYVPNRPFAKNLQPDSIVTLVAIPNSNFFSFEYNFVTDGKARYLTFGTFIEEDTVAGRKKLVGTQTVSLVLDNFQLVPADPNETTCADFTVNKDKIYAYNFRHKEMDYSLYGKGELAIVFNNRDSGYITQIKEPVPEIKPDTLKLGDVFFDFNKAILKPAASKMLESFFINSNSSLTIDSIIVEGHTDSVGSDSRNLTLSLQRCESIQQWLVLNNIADKASIEIRPFGRSKPIATNKTPGGRALNRRVEMIVFRRGKN